MGTPFEIYRANCDGSNSILIASNVAQPNYVDYGWDALPIGQYKYGISTDGGNNISWSECLEKDVLGVNEPDGLEANVYPNPVSDVLFMKNLPCETVEYSIFNVLGQMVMTGSSNGTISVAGLEKGIYFLQIKGENFCETAKFVVE